MSQKDAILDHLRQGKEITPLEALNKYGCFRLASIINRLRNEGFDIITNIVQEGGIGEVKTFARYHLRSMVVFNNIVA